MYLNVRVCVQDNYLDVKDSNTPFTRSKHYLDRDLDRNLEDGPVYTGHALFNTTKRITLLFIVQLFLHHNPPNIWI